MKHNLPFKAAKLKSLGPQDFGLHLTMRTVCLFVGWLVT